MRTADRYCDLSGFDPLRSDTVFYAHDASAGSLIEIDGTRTITSDSDFLDHITLRFAAVISQLIKRPGHQFSISFESSSNTADRISRFKTEQSNRTLQKGLSLDALLEENADMLNRRSRHEKVLLAAWTRPRAGVSKQVRQERVRNLKSWRSLPPAPNAQNPYLHLQTLEGAHQSFVKRMEDALIDTGLQARVLGLDEGGRRDLEEIRRMILFHETPVGWNPVGPGTRKYPEVKEKNNESVDCFFTPTLARQIMTANVVSKDLRTLEIGGRRYAPMAMRMFPAHLMAFNKLLSPLVSANDQSGLLPFRICIHIEPIGDRDTVMMRLRKLVAGVLKSTNSANGHIFANLRDLEKFLSEDNEALIKVRLLATTWIEPGEDPSWLEIRRARLMSALMTWGDAIVTDSPADPMRTLCETAPGLTLQAKTVNAAFAPVGDVATMLPFHRQAPVFKTGQSMMLTLDGRLAPYEAHSSAQAFWLTLIYATPGSGKSVLMNRLNLDFAAFTPGQNLPFIGIIDVGVSSSGFIDLIQNDLPPERRHEAIYVRLINDSRHAINPFDLGLGRRQPLAREQEFGVNFLTTLLNLTDEEAKHLVPRLVTRLYQLKSDQQFGSQPTVYQSGLDPEIDDAIGKYAIKVSAKTRWWKVVDDLMVAGDELRAHRAQRQAMPTLPDLGRVLGEPVMARDFGPDLIRKAQRALEAAIDKYPLFSQTTVLDVGEARIVAIDLQDVALPVTGPESERNNALMYMIARHAFLGKISGWHEEIASMDLPTDPGIRNCYIRYWHRRYSEIAETLKRLCMDEYHKTGNNPSIERQVTTDVREGRKWLLEIILVSQKLKDFKSLSNMAATAIILNADSNEDREEARTTFGFNDAVKETLERHVHGPRGSRGANFLARIKLREEERWVVLTNILGPRLSWALTTKAEDRILRDELYRRHGVNKTLAILARQYPEGTAIDHWKRFATQVRAGDDSIVKAMADHISRQAEITALERKEAS